MHGKDLLINGIKELGLEISDIQIEQFCRYYEMLVEKNKVMNLTSITDFDEVVIKHYIDSLLVVKVIPINECKTMIDIGTGAGFPGIPIKIMFPHLKVTLLDSLNKRLDFLNDVIKELELKNITTVHGRAEDFGKKEEYREKFELCVSRAVANLSTLCEYCVPFILEGGRFVSYKSQFSTEEKIEAEKAIDILGGRIKANKLVKLPFTEIKRSFIIIDKIKKTPDKYPRKAGIPLKKPIK